METTVAYIGTARQTAFGFVLPEFVPVAPGSATLDVMNLSHNCVPLKLENGMDYCKVLPEESIDTLCLVFKVVSDDHEGNHKAIHEFLSKIEIDETKFHVAHRALLDEQNEVRTFYYRVYRNEDFACKEHPEMLLGTPYGMYHCPHCTEMQLAGTMHMGADV